MTTADFARCTIVVFVVLAVQHALLDFVHVGGAHPDMTWILPAAAGYVGGPERGAWFGFGSGLVADLFLPTTFGLSALVGCLLGYAVGVATSGTSRSSWWLFVLISAAATAIGMAAYAILGAVLGQSQELRVYLAPAVEVAVPAALVLAVPVLRFVAWAVPPAPSSTAPAGGGIR
jgi:rod shape-determining protein MreD